MAMGQVVVVASSKGGCGKSLLCTALAINLIRRGYAVTVTDGDPNQTFTAWFKLAENPGIEASSCVSEDEIVGHLLAKAENCDVTICDTGGWMNQTTVFSFGAADMVLLPVMPDRGSVLEARRTARKIESVGEIARREIPYRVVLSRWTPKGLLERATLSDLTAANLPHLTQHIPNLTAFAKAGFSGEMPSTGFIGHVLSQLIDELIGLGAVPPKAKRSAA